MSRKKNKKRLMGNKLIVQENPNSVISEQYRTIGANINFSMVDHELKTIIVTSAMAGEGKSTTSANLATVFTKSGKKVLLIDADLRKPTTHYTFNIKNTYGLSDVLSRQCELEQAIQETYILGLYLLPSGTIPPNPAELLQSNRMNQLIELLKTEFDLIIFDSPPIMAVTDSIILSNKCDATILVINCGETKKETVAKAKELLHFSKANIIGIILNNYKIEKNQYYYSRYYGYGEAK